MVMLRAGAFIFTILAISFFMFDFLTDMDKKAFTRRNIFRALRFAAVLTSAIMVTAFVVFTLVNLG